MTTENRPRQDVAMPSKSASEQLSTFLRKGEAQALIALRSPKTRDGLRQTCSAIKRAPTDEEIVACIEALSSFYPDTGALSEQARRLRWRIWLDKLADTPADLMALACDRWLDSTERFMPTPGQLKALIADELRIRSLQVQRAREWLAMSEPKNSGEGDGPDHV